MPDLRPQGPMGCRQVARLLPFYLNASLDAEEARRIETHVASCADCRREERDTRTAWALYDGHLPVELLLDYALGQPMPARGRAVVESHLAGCRRCAEEVATVRQERPEPVASAKPAFDASRPSAKAGGSGLRILAWAACLLAIVASAGWILSWRQLADARARSAPAVRANLPVVELLPAAAGLLRLGGASQAVANRVELPTAGGEVVLVLLSGSRACASGCGLEIYPVGTAEAEPGWRVEGLVANPDGHLTLAVPGVWLPPGRSVLAVLDSAGEPVAEYLVEIPSQSSRQPPR